MSAEPAVQREFLAAEVAVENSMVKVVKVGTGGERVFCKRFFEAVMALRRTKHTCEFTIEEEVNGMGGNNEMDQDDAEIEEVLDRVHGQAGPGAGVRISVVQIMDGFEKGAPVDEAVDTVEMQVTPKGDQTEPDGEINGMGGPVHVRNLFVG